MTASEKFPRGSEWRQWDLHVHTPASFHWTGEKFGTSAAKNAALVDAMIGAANGAEPAVFALQDYFTFDGWFELKKRLGEAGAPALSKTIFPGIELRLSAPMDGRLNAHVIFSNEIDDQYLRDFLARLRLELTDQPLSRHALIQYAKGANTDKLKHHGFDKTKCADDDAYALRAGYEIAEITVKSYQEAVQAVPQGMAVGFMPFSTNDGLESVKWAEHYAYALSLFSTSPIFETRDVAKWAAFVGIETAANRKYFASFREALKNTPRLAVSGSDAHMFVGTAGDSNKRGYGDYPSGQKTWIKADPTWNGLIQAIKEPANRSFLGEVPTKMEFVSKNKTFYISQLQINKVENSALPESWLDGCQIPLNTDLVAIIGNKGSGKSALADIVALLGNSQQRSHFSFLRKDRFRGKSGEPARQFVGTLQWVAGQPNSMLLSDDPSSEKVELVRYIPQGRFEALCNDHVAGKSDAFENELRAVIFSHVPSATRLDALDFNQLLEQQETTFRAALAEMRKTLRQLNTQIVGIEDQLHPDVEKNLSELIQLKQNQLEEHIVTRPKEVPAPTGEATPEQTAASTRLAEIAVEIGEHEETLRTNGTAQDQSARRLQAIKSINDRLNIVEGQFKAFSSAIAQDLLLLELKLEDVANLSIKRDALGARTEATTVERKKLVDEISKVTARLNALKDEQESLTASLNEPQQRYQKYLTDEKAWLAAHEAIEGSATQPDSKKGLEVRLEQIAALPGQLEELKLERLELARKIFQVLSSQRDARAALFAPVQALIQGNALIGKEYKLKFQANLQGSPELIAGRLFEMVKQAVGQLRGEDESFAVVRQRFEKHGFKDADDTTAFATDLHELVAEASQASGGAAPGIRAALRKDRDPTDVYDFIFGLQYLEPKYTLLFQETEIEQLSPGQRGALLLIFYLLVDQGRNPIVLDQPEENLDNETVVKLLVPVLNEAKKCRQILMVTHNPNLAVVCDAEQIIHATFDRKNGAKVSYSCGSIEDGVINRAVVDVLEGTKIAFDSRGRTYHR
ncbi:ABC transporter [Candidatus Saccharibacteria bacterium]|nr:ABC transporter [Candidatus Saccharibacteria bacterium]